MTTALGVGLIAIIVAIDNALLTGLLLPSTRVGNRRTTIVVVGLLLGASQIVMAASVDRMLHNAFFRCMAIALLGWMCIRTIGMVQTPTRRAEGWTATVKLWAYTAIGNLDNMLWLGSALKGQLVGLTVSSVATIPVFVLISLFLSDQCDRQKWILPLGAGMMAWAASSLVLEFPTLSTFVHQLDDAPRTTLQCLITLCILLIGLGVRQIVLPDGRLRR